MKKLNKKAFTIVELIVVIVIIGILAAILIPNVVKYIDQTKVVKDKELVSNLNKALVTDSLVNGKHETAYDAFKAAEDFGYIVPRIDASKVGNDILWDSENDQFVYIEDGQVNYVPEYTGTKITDKDSYKLFKVYTSAPATQTNSIYWNSDAAFTADLNVGFDSGESTGVTSLNYVGKTSSQNVVIRTNSASTALTIDDAYNGTINHYGSVGSLNIIQCNTESYHENGKVAFAEILKGRIVLEEGSKIEHIHINKKTNSSFDTVIIRDNGAETLPEKITRDEVSVEVKTLVVKVETKTVEEEVFVYSNGSSGSTQKITEGENKQNVDVNSNLGKLVLDNGENSDKVITATVKEFVKEQAIYTTLVEELIDEYPGDYWIDAHSNSFNGGSGTESDPYLISTPMELALVAYNVNNNIDNGSYAGAYYKLTANIDLSSKYWTGIGTWQYPFHGSIDGYVDEENVYTISGMHDGGIATQGAMFRNYTTRTVGGPYGLISVAGSKIADCDLSVKNLKITGINIDLSEGNAVGAVIGFAPRTKDFGITFTDPKGENGEYWISDDWKQGLIGSSHNNDYKYAFYFAEENRWYKETTYKIGDTYYQGMAGAVGVGNKAIRNIIIENVYTEGTISALDLASGIIGKAYNSGSFTVNNCEIHCDITATGGRAAGIAGYASVPSSVVITNNVIVGKISATSTGVAPDYLTGSRDNNPINETNIVASGDSSKFTCTGNSFSGEIWWQGNKQE